MRGLHAAAFLVTITGSVAGAVAAPVKPVAGATSGAQSSETGRTGWTEAAAVAVFAPVVADLGDPERTEAAEQALLADWERAQPALAALVGAWSTATPRDVQRLRAALRAVHLAGTASDDVVTALGQALDSAVATLKKSTDRASIELNVALVDASIAALTTPTTAARHAPALLTRSRGQGGWLVATARIHARQHCGITDADTARDALERDELGAREVACAVLGTHGNAADAARMRARLLARDRPPRHEIRHNGFLADVTDEFALRAAQAILRLTPYATENAIAHATLAVVHPHRSVRLASLRALTGCGPYVADAAPELLRLAAADDEELATAALQALLPAAATLGRHRAAVAVLTAGRPPAIASRAQRLLTSVDAAGPPPAATEAELETELLRARVALLSDTATPDAAAVVAEVLAAGAAAWPHLRERYRRERNDAPKSLVRLIGLVGRHLPEDDHADVRTALVTQGDVWTSSSGGVSYSAGGKPARERLDAYAMLTVGPPSPAALAAALERDCPAVRRYAAGAASDDASLVANAGPDSPGRRLVTALLAAARADHPKRLRTTTGTRSWADYPLDLTDEIRTLAATALIPAALGGDDAAAMLEVLDRTGDATVARAVRAWGQALGHERLTKLAADPRREVAAAAATALAKLRDGAGK